MPPIAPVPGAIEFAFTPPKEVVAAGIEPATRRSPLVLRAPSLAPCFRDAEADTPDGSVTVSGGKESFLLWPFEELPEVAVLTDFPPPTEVAADFDPPPFLFRGVSGVRVACAGEGWAALLFVVRSPATTEAAVAGAAAARAAFADDLGPFPFAFCAFFLPPLVPAVGSPVTTAVAGVDVEDVDADIDADRAGPEGLPVAAADGERVPAATLENPVTLAEAERFSDGLPI